MPQGFTSVYTSMHVTAIILNDGFHSVAKCLSSRAQDLLRHSSLPCTNVPIGFRLPGAPSIGFPSCLLRHAGTFSATWRDG